MRTWRRATSPRRVRATVYATQSLVNAYLGVAQENLRLAIALLDRTWPRI